MYYLKRTRGSTSRLLMTLEGNSDRTSEKEMRNSTRSINTLMSESAGSASPAVWMRSLPDRTEGGAREISGLFLLENTRH